MPKEIERKFLVTGEEWRQGPGVVYIARGVPYGPDDGTIAPWCTEMIWRLMKQCPYLVRGLRQAGFSGGWLDK